MNVEKFIRALVYVVYATLWLPVIIICLVVMPVVWLVTFMRSDMSVKEAIMLYALALKNGIKHDVNFIRTGIW